MKFVAVVSIFLRFAASAQNSEDAADLIGGSNSSNNGASTVGTTTLQPKNYSQIEALNISEVPTTIFVPTTTAGTLEFGTNFSSSNTTTDKISILNFTEKSNGTGNGASSLGEVSTSLKEKLADGTIPSTTGKDEVNATENSLLSTETSEAVEVSTLSSMLTTEKIRNGTKSDTIISGETTSEGSTPTSLPFKTDPIVIVNNTTGDLYSTEVAMSNSDEVSTLNSNSLKEELADGTHTEPTGIPSTTDKDEVNATENSLLSIEPSEAVEVSTLSSMLTTEKIRNGTKTDTIILGESTSEVSTLTSLPFKTDPIIIVSNTTGDLYNTEAATSNLGEVGTLSGVQLTKNLTENMNTETTNPSTTTDEVYVMDSTENSNWNKNESSNLGAFTTLTNFSTEQIDQSTGIETTTPNTTDMWSTLEFMHTTKNLNFTDIGDEESGTASTPSTISIESIAGTTDETTIRNITDMSSTLDIVQTTTEPNVTNSGHESDTTGTSDIVQTNNFSGLEDEESSNTGTPGTSTILSITIEPTFVTNNDTWGTSDNTQNSNISEPENEESSTTGGTSTTFPTRVQWINTETTTSSTDIASTSDIFQGTNFPESEGQELNALNISSTVSSMENGTGEGEESTTFNSFPKTTETPGTRTTIPGTTDNFTISSQSNNKSATVPATILSTTDASIISNTLPSRKNGTGGTKENNFATADTGTATDNLVTFTVSPPTPPSKEGTTSEVTMWSTIDYLGDGLNVSGTVPTMEASGASEKSVLRFSIIGILGFLLLLV